METRVYLDINRYLSEDQIKRHGLAECKATQSVLAQDKSNIVGVVDKNGDSLLIYLQRRGGKFIVKQFD